MKDIDILSMLKVIPGLLSDFSKYSYLLLLLIAFGGVIILIIHSLRKRRKEKGLPSVFIILATVILFISFSGIIIKFSDGWTMDDEISQFIPQNKVDKESHWLLLIDFSIAKSSNKEEKERHRSNMQRLAAQVSTILAELDSEAFPQPKVKSISLTSSPWESGVTDANYQKILTSLNGDEILWGIGSGQNNLRVTAFLAMAQNLIEPHIQNAVSKVPLQDINMEEVLDKGLEYNPTTYDRLRAMVMLGMALETANRAEVATGDAQKAEYAKASMQLIEMQRLLINSKEDVMIKRAIYSVQIDRLITKYLDKAGLVL